MTNVLSSGDVERICRGCGLVFTIDAAERRSFENMSSRLPWHCGTCRWVRRQEQEPVVTATDTPMRLICMECNGVFGFSVRDQAFFADQQWSAPRRCKTCRARRAAERAEREVRP